MKAEIITLTVTKMNKTKTLISGTETHWKQQNVTVPPFLVEGYFPFVFPHDTVDVCGTFQHHPQRGFLFFANCFREHWDDWYFMKWLVMNRKAGKKEILSLWKQNTLRSSFQRVSEKMEVVRSFHDWLIQQGVSFSVVSKIEEMYRFREQELWGNSQVYHSYEEIPHALVKQGMRDFFASSPSPSLYTALFRTQQNGHSYALPSDMKGVQTNLFSFLKQTEPGGHRVDEVAYSSPSVLRIRGAKDITGGEEEIWMLRDWWEREQYIANTLVRRNRSPRALDPLPLIREWEKTNSMELAPQQVQGVDMALRHHVSVLTGGPGVGKTTVCKAIIDLLQGENTIRMVAPTGRAAKRAEESTGVPASTIHSLLGYNGEEFRLGADNQMETDVLIIDESSMVDTLLMYHLLQSTPLETKLLFVGDVDQIPSVGAGQVLRDLIESDVLPVTRLTQIFRQAAGSPIITTAYEVNRGEMPSPKTHDDYIHLSFETEEELAQHALETATTLYREHSLFDVQILIPMYGGYAGIDRINGELQKTLNPGKGVRVGGYELRKGDKVIQTDNVRSKGVFNGDIGMVEICSPEEISVRFQGANEPVRYIPPEFGQLKLAYAITTHRSQGSEYMHVIIPVATGYGRMLQKNLFYTAITRAKRKLYLLAQPKALETAVKLESVPVRRSLLRSWLRYYRVAKELSASPNKE